MSRLGRSRPASAYTFVRPASLAPLQVAQADTAAASDALTVAAAVPLADTAAAADALQVSTAVPLSDTAAAADAAASSVPVAVSDTAAAADALTVSAAVPLADTAAAADASANLTPQPGDSAAAADKLAVSTAVPLADTAAAADALQVSAAVPLADTAAAADTRTVPTAAVPLHDTAAAADSAATANAGIPTLIGTLPGNVGNQVNPPGYQGGPSGAASVTPSAVGNSWEIYAYSGLDYVTLLAVIPMSMLLSFQFVRQLDDIGSGTVVLSLDDPWWAAVTLPGGLPAKTLLDEECLWQFRKDGVPRFEFLGETVTEQLTDPSEQRIVTVTGPGTIAALKWAMVAPQGFPTIVLKLDGILDSFDEVDVNGNPVLDTNIWTTATPLDHIYITPVANQYSYPGGVGYNLGTLYPSGSLTLLASPGGTLLGASPYDATDTLISAQVTPVGAVSTSTDATNPAPYGANLNGSELTQFFVRSNFNHAYYAMIALSLNAFYAQAGGPDGNFTALLPPYDPNQHAYWMITEQAGAGGGSGTFYFWTSPDGQNWTLQWQRVHFWDATDTTFFFWAYYSVDKAFSAQITNLNSNVTTPSYQGSIYLGQPLMGVWYDQFSKAQARGTIPFVTSNVTPAADSYGRAWSDVQNVQTVNGTDLYSLLQSGTAVVNADYVMDPGFQLRVGQPAPGRVALGVDRSGYLILRDGSDVAAKGRIRARNQITTLLGGENADGHEISASSPAFIAEWGQRETWFQAAVQVDPASMTFASAAALAQNETEILSWTFTLIPNISGKTIFDNFDVGDWVGLERPDFSAVDAVRVVGIAVQVDSTGAETHELTFLSYIQWLAERLTYLADKLGGKFVNSLGTSPVAPSKYGTGQVPTYFTPAATLNSLADVAGFSAGSSMSHAPLVYNPGTGQYQHAGTTDPVSGTMVPVTVQTPAGSATVTDTTVLVNTGNGTVVVGLQGDGTVTTVDSGGTAPAVPDTPTVAASVQGLQASWDGLLAGAAPLSNFLYVEFHLSTASGFTPSSATLVHTQSAAATISVTGLLPGTTYYVRLVAVSTAGNASAPSVQASATAAGLPAADLTGQLPASTLGNSAGSWALNPNPFFNGGDLSGWTVVNGSLSSTASVPSGAPGHPPYAAVVTSTSASCLITGVSAPFNVTAGQPYAMTAWIYNPSGSAVNVAIGFNWAGGTATVSCAPNAWTPLNTVQSCPALVTSAYQVLGPTASGVTVYVTAAVAAGQVSGQLLIADSVTANQIAANTITAGQIAANTITASQIAANTITAAQIAASTITATQIAAGTITASKLVSGIVVAGIVDATTITGATVVADGTSGEFLAYSGTPASGNLIMSFAAAANTDAYGNAYSKGLTVGSPSGSTPQVALVPSAGGVGTPALLQFPLSPTSFFGNQPSISALSPSSSGQMYINGPALAQVGNRDWVQIGLVSDLSGFYSRMFFTFVDDGHTGHTYMQMDDTGVNIFVCNTVTGSAPGTVTGVTPAVAETWQTATLINGWTGTGGGVNGIRYRMLPLFGGLIEVEGEVINATATGNSTAATMGSFYRPPANRNHPASWNNPQASNAASAPWVFTDTSGNISITGIQVANKGIFFHIFIPMD